MRTPLALIALLLLAACGATAQTATPAAPAATAMSAPMSTLGVTAAAPTRTTAPTASPVVAPPSPTVAPPSPTAAPPSPPPDGLAAPRPAPEIADEIWLNGPPQSLAALRQAGRVALVEFWTFGCYNCRNVLPALRGWHTKYTAAGLTIIGVHYPEFSHEREVPNVERALAELDVRYPVAIDNDGRTWRAYHQNAWPTLYLVDKRGNIRYVHIGEGAYETTEQWI